MGKSSRISGPSLAASALGGGDLLCAAAFVAAAVLVTFDAWRDTLQVAFSDEECSYVLLAPVVIGWLGWVRRDRLRNCPLRWQWIGLAGLLIGWGAGWYGYLNDPVIWRAGAVLVAIAAFTAAVGLSAAVRLAPALAAGVFLIPIDPAGRYHIAGPLGTATAFAAQWTCEALGMSVSRSGNLLSTNGVDVTIAEACNGLRMVLTLFLVCYVVAFSFPFKAWLRLLLLLAAAPLVAIASNVIRLIPTLWMFGHVSRTAAEQFHHVGGWVMTLVAFIGLMFFAFLLQWLAQPTPNSKAVPRPARTRPVRGAGI